MKRLFLISAAVLAAGGLAAAPAVAGLTGNPSFSHQIPVRVPSQAHVPQFVDDRGTDVGSPTATRPSRSDEPGDDHGGRTRHAEPGDDRGRSSGESEPGDDRNRGRSASEPGDDRSGRTTSTERDDDRGRKPSAEPGDDHGGSSDRHSDSNDNDNDSGHGRHGEG